MKELSNFVEKITGTTSSDVIDKRCASIVLWATIIENLFILRPQFWGWVPFLAASMFLALLIVEVYRPQIPLPSRDISTEDGSSFFSEKAEVQRTEFFADIWSVHIFPTHNPATRWRLPTKKLSLRQRTIIFTSCLLAVNLLIGCIYYWWLFTH